MKSIYFLVTLTCVICAPSAPSIITVADGGVQKDNHHDSTNLAVVRTEDSFNKDIGPKRVDFNEFIIQRDPDVVTQFVEVPVVTEVFDTEFAAPRRFARVADEDAFVEDSEVFIEEKEEQRDQFVEELAAGFFDSPSDVTIDNE
jgi:hypothetical protein